MLDPEFSIRDDFPSLDHAQWRALVDGGLAGTSFEELLIKSTYEGIELHPVYTRDDWPGESNLAERSDRNTNRSAPDWDLRQEHSSLQPKEANAAILADVEGGVSSLLLFLDRASQAGFDPDDERVQELVGRGGIMAYRFDDFDTALANVDLSTIGVCLEPGAAFLPAAAIVAALWSRRETTPDAVRGAFNADPIAVLARTGQLPYTLENALTQMSALAVWTAQHYSRVRAIGVDTSPYHHAGASATQDLALALATGVQYLRSMTDAGMDIDAAAQQIVFRLSVGTKHFLTIAKLRAARRLWSRVVEVCGGSPASADVQIHARLSDRVLTRFDPHNNLLRNTIGVFAAGLGGANAITSVPFDRALGESNDFSRRLARNTALILQEESHLHHVIDPAGGSWYLEKLTDQVAEKSWDIFQEIERQGGMISALGNGWVAEQIESVSSVREADIANCKQGIVGVSVFPRLSEQRISRELTNQQELGETAARRIKAIRKECKSLSSLSSASPCMPPVVAAATDGATLGQLCDTLGFHRESIRITQLELKRLAEPFEALRDACHKGVGTP